MMPNLTPEQKEHLKIAHRASIRIEETWQLFTMYLQQDKRPAEALQLAREAVDAWADWMDANVVEPPDIEHPDFGQQVGESMQKAMETLAKSGAFRRPLALELEPDGKALGFEGQKGIEAEFTGDAPELQGRDGPTQR